MSEGISAESGTIILRSIIGNGDRVLRNDRRRNLGHTERLRGEGQWGTKSQSKREKLHESKNLENIKTRALLDLDINFADILTDDTKADEHTAGAEPDGEHD